MLLYTTQLVLLGDSGVGKSCIVLRFVRGQFDPESKVFSYKLICNVLYPGESSYRLILCCSFLLMVQVTVGASFLSQTIALQDSTTVKFEIWDTAGQERLNIQALT